MSVLFILGVLVIAAIVIIFRGGGGRIAMLIVAVAAVLVFGQGNPTISRLTDTMSGASGVVESVGSVAR